MNAKRDVRVREFEPGMLSLRSFVAAEAEANIRAALLLRDACDGSGITVSGSDTRLSINGAVHSWSEFRTASEAAWSTPGVTEVDNQLEMRLSPCPCAPDPR